jgi:NitT/TauT family transport system ATP-binding protein
MNSSPTTPTANEMIDITCSGVGHTYIGRNGPVLALEEINLQIKRETIFVIVGPSGCGKSTLLRLMLKLEEPTKGRIVIATDRQDKISYVPQSADLLPWRTAIQNACLGLEIREGDKLAGKKLAYLRSEFRHYGLTDFENAPWDSLSGGMRQKVTLICALAGDPEILLCDEPFSAVDFVTRLGMLNHFKRACMKGATTVFVTHNIEEAIFLGEEIAVMSHRPGRIKNIYPNEIGRDAVDSVLCRKHPRFQELFDMIWKDLKEG